MPVGYGASAERWTYWSSTLGLTADLLPTISNPNATISPDSNMRALGKTPSRYNGRREVAGFPKWTSYEATEQDVERWSREPDYGISVQCRRLRAIDIDVEASGAVVKVLVDALGIGDWPMRGRKGSGKCLIPFWMEDELYKHVIPVDGGMVEVLGSGQQFIAEGTHPKGERYEWEGNGEIPELDAIGFALLLARLRTIATGEIRIARAKRAPTGADIESDDTIAKWLLENWETYDAGSSGQIFIACPFADQHSSDTGPSSTAYFPAGTGGYAEGSFVCLHAHCTGRDQAEFLNATGATAGQFASLSEDSAPPRREFDSVREPGSDSLLVEHTDPVREARQITIAEDRWPKLTRSGDKIESTMDNLVKAIGAPAMTGRHIAHDVFKDMIVWAPADRARALAEWQPLRDVDYAWIRCELEKRGFKPMGAEMLRLAVLAAADGLAIDTAREWLSRLAWDGVPRIEEFCQFGWGWLPTAYAAAVGRYAWTGLAGRVLQPGVQADMAPILIGPQGIRKTSAIKAMAPAPDFYAEINLADRDNDTSRKMRGKLVVELEELRGLNSRAQEEILAFITRTHEEWVPKFREFATSYARRLMFFGSGNEDEILNNPNGERRWLPGKCVNSPDPDWIARWRDQLWAEGAAWFRMDGVDWEEAEMLAKAEHAAFKISDAWEPYVRHWLATDDPMQGMPSAREYLTLHDALTSAIGVQAAQIDRGKEMRMGKVLRSLGWERGRRRVDGDPSWVFVKSCSSNEIPARRT